MKPLYILTPYYIDHHLGGLQALQDEPRYAGNMLLNDPQLPLQGGKSASKIGLTTPDEPGIRRRMLALYHPLAGHVQQTAARFCSL